MMLNIDINIEHSDLLNCGIKQVLSYRIVHNFNKAIPLYQHLHLR